MRDHLPSTNRPEIVTPFFDRFYREESGQDLVEYALIALAVGLSTVAGVHGLASSIIGYLNFITNGFISAT